MSRPHIAPCQFLPRLHLFAELAPDRIAAIAAATTGLHATRGQLIFERGAPCTGIHAVIYGDVKLSVASPEGDEKVVDLIGPGQSLGEAPLFMERSYIASAEALDDCLLLHIDRAAIFDEVERDPRFARRLLAGMGRRLHGLIADVESYTLRSASQRIAGYLLKDDPQQGAQINFAACKKMIASRLNLTPEYFSRVLHEMAGRGMVGIAGRNVTILDVAGLRAWEGWAGLQQAPAGSAP